MLCGAVPEPEGGIGGIGRGGGQAGGAADYDDPEAGQRENDPFVEQNPAQSP